MRTTLKNALIFFLLLLSSCGKSEKENIKEDNPKQVIEKKVEEPKIIPPDTLNLDNFRNYKYKSIKNNTLSLYDNNFDKEIDTGNYDFIYEKNAIYWYESNGKLNKYHKKFEFISSSLSPLYKLQHGYRYKIKNNRLYMYDKFGNLFHYNFEWYKYETHHIRHDSSYKSYDVKVHFDGPAHLWGPEFNNVIKIIKIESNNNELAFLENSLVIIKWGSFPTGTFSAPDFFLEYDADSLRNVTYTGKIRLLKPKESKKNYYDFNGFLFIGDM